RRHVEAEELVTLGARPPVIRAFVRRLSYRLERAAVDTVNRPGVAGRPVGSKTDEERPARRNRYRLAVLLFRDRHGLARIVARLPRPDRGRSSECQDEPARQRQSPHPILLSVKCRIPAAALPLEISRPHAVSQRPSSAALSTGPLPSSSSPPDSGVSFPPRSS